MKTEPRHLERRPRAGTAPDGAAPAPLDDGALEAASGGRIEALPASTRPQLTPAAPSPVPMPYPNVDGK